MEKGQEKQLNIAMHCWDSENPKKLGEPRPFIITQCQSCVRHVVEKIANIDIRLAMLGKDIVFVNKFLDILAFAKSLLAFQDIHFKDKFMVDSYVTGM